MLQKQSLPINFSKGLDLKTDEFQVAPGNFLSLENQIFTKGGRLTKRNGYAQLTTLPNTSSVYLTTLNDNLTTIGDSIYAYNESSATWVSKGTIAPMEVNTLPLIRNNLNQSQCDAAIAANGLVCTVYTEVNNGVSAYKYAIADSITGQNIVAPTAIPVSSGVVTGSPRVFVIYNLFIIVFTNVNVITSTSHLQYIAISAQNPSVATTNADIAANYVSSTTLDWDGVVVDQNLYLAWNNTVSAQSVKVTYLSSSLASIGGAPFSPINFATYKATLMSLCADITVPSTPVIWVNFYRSDTSLGYALAVDPNLNVLLAPTATIASGTIVNIASAAKGGASNSVCSLFAEVSNFYSYDSSVPTNYIENYQVTYAGVVTGPAVSIRSAGLASKAFIVDGTIYFLSEYLSQYQPTYFLINGSTSTASSPVVVGKLAYENGNTVPISSATLGYLPLGLPAVTIVNGNEAYVPYLYKDLISAVNKGTNIPSGTQTAGIYSQTGINLGTFTIGTQNIDTAEIGNDLLISGGFLWMYDGYLPVEQNFFLFPDNVEATITADIGVTGTTHTGTNSITAITTTGIVVGMTVSGTDIPALTTVIAVTGSTVTMSNNAVTGHTETITFGGGLGTSGTYYYQVTYEWTDNQGNAYRSAPSIPVTITSSSAHTFAVINIPTLRLTYKTANPVKIVIYRWSVAQEIYYQVTSLTAPLLNSTTSDNLSYTDVLSDAQILGNNIIYTTGGVVEDVNAPASNVFTLFDTRFWLVDAEDQNLLWFSKQVIENTPVEMSDLFTFYVAPTQAAQGSTGPIGALAPMDDKLIIFKQRPGVYYINGTGPDNTGSNNQYSQPIFITTTVGCNNQQSVIMTPNGLMFQAVDGKGIWLLGRDLSTNYIGAPVEAYNSSVVQSAVNVPNTNQIRFTLNTGETLVYDYYYEQWSTFVGVPAISSCVYHSLHTFLNSYGQVYQESPGVYLDGSNPVLLGLTTSWYNLAGLQGYQRAYFFYLLGQYLTPHKLQVTIAYDYNSSPTQSSLISPTNYSAPYGDVSPYGQGNPYGGESDIEQWRVFLTKQRCQSFQISIQEVYDPSFGVSAGAGLTLSGINLIWGFKKGFRPISAAHSIGGGTA